jgi:Bacterial extracellular solute-binding protein
MAFDATADEQSTCQIERFFWSNGASLTNVDQPSFESALQLWVNMVKDGSASKSVLNWGQDPDLTQQFIQGHAAMMVNGPWIFPELNQHGWKYNDQYGIVPIPTDTAGQTVIAPLGGETIDMGAGGSTEQQKLTWEWVQGMQPRPVRHARQLRRAAGDHRGRLRHPDPGQRAAGRHLVLHLRERLEGRRRGAQPGRLDPVPGQRHHRDLLLHRQQQVSPPPRGDLEGGVQPAERITADRRHVVYPTHVARHPAQAQPARG